MGVFYELLSLTAMILVTRHVWRFVKGRKR